MPIALQEIKDAWLRQLGRVSNLVNNGQWSQVRDEITDTLNGWEGHDNWGVKDQPPFSRQAGIESDLSKALAAISNRNKNSAKTNTANAITRINNETVAAPEEPPPPPPPPTESPSRIISSLAGWKGQHWPSRPGAITEVADVKGLKAIHMSVLPTDGSPGVGTKEGTTRAQLEDLPSTPEDEEIWTRGRFHLPENFSSGSGWGVNIVEPYFDKGNGPPPWQLQARGSYLESRSFDNSLFGRVELNPLKGFWTTWAVGRLNRADGKGWLELHINDLSGDHPVVPRQPLSLGAGRISTPFSGHERFIIQCYYQLSQGAKELDHEDEVVFGRTLESVR